MAWERRGGSLFFYRSRRTPEGKVIKEYVGQGERASSAAAVVAHSKAQRQADRRAVQEEQARLADPDGLTLELTEVAQVLLEATLLAGGFHRHNYGKWRKRRAKDGNPETT